MSARSTPREIDVEWSDNMVYVKRRLDSETEQWSGDWFTVEEAEKHVRDLQSAIKSAKSGRR